MAKVLINTMDHSKLVASRVVSSEDIAYTKMSDNLSYFIIKTTSGEEIQLSIVNEDAVEDATDVIHRMYTRDNAMIKIDLYVFEGSTYVDSIK
jgi:hypothetical protein